MTSELVTVITSDYWSVNQSLKGISLILTLCVQRGVSSSQWLYQISIFKPSHWQVLLQFSWKKTAHGFRQTVQLRSLFKVKNVLLPLRKLKYKGNYSESYHPLKDKVPAVSSPLSSLRRWSLQLTLAKTAACRRSHAWNFHRINKKNPQKCSPNSR